MMRQAEGDKELAAVAALGARTAGSCGAGAVQSAAGPGHHVPAARGPPGAFCDLCFPWCAGKGVTWLWASSGGGGPVYLRSFAVGSEGCIIILFFSLSSSGLTHHFPDLNATQSAEVAKTRGDRQGVLPRPPSEGAPRGGPGQKRPG